MLELDEGLDPSLLLRMTLLLLALSLRELEEFAAISLLLLDFALLEEDSSSMLDDESPSGLTKLLSSSPHATKKNVKANAKM